MKLYVGNLTYSTTEADVRAIFEQAGAVGSCELVSDRFTGQSRGFAFVEMTSPAAGAEAIQRFNDYEFDGRKLIVNEARPRESRVVGFGGGGPGHPSGNAGAGAFGAKRKSGKGSRRNARSAKRERKACW